MPYLRLLLIALTAFAIAGCSSIRRSGDSLTLTKKDRSSIVLSKEDSFLDSIVAQPLPWPIGKRFYATDNRALLIFDQRNLPVDFEKEALEGKILQYCGTDTEQLPDGTTTLLLKFSCDSLLLRYPTGIVPEAATRFRSMSVPMLVDLDIIDAMRKKLMGKKLWTKSLLWYDAAGNRIPGKKFVEVEITDISPGDISFPLKVSFRDKSGRDACFMMNFGNELSKSRSFPVLFSLSDPHLKYPDILPEYWDCIQRGTVLPGMSKDECRLSIGNPADVDSGHDYTRTLDVWHYSDGRYLMFVDGLLSKYRF